MPLILFCPDWPVNLNICQIIFFSHICRCSKPFSKTEKVNKNLLVSGWPSGLSLPKSLWPSRQRTGHQVESLLWKHHRILLWRHLCKCPACRFLLNWQVWRGEITTWSLLATGPGSRKVIGEERLDSALLPAAVGLKMANDRCEMQLTQSCWLSCTGLPNRTWDTISNPNHHYF